jgi:hypothetical protein
VFQNVSDKNPFYLDESTQDVFVHFATLETGDVLHQIEGFLNSVIAKTEFTKFMDRIVRYPDTVWPPFQLPSGHPLADHMDVSSIPTVSGSPALLLHGLDELHKREFSELKEAVQLILQQTRAPYSAVNVIVGASGIGQSISHKVVNGRWDFPYSNSSASHWILLFVIGCVRCRENSYNVRSFELDLRRLSRLPFP